MEKSESRAAVIQDELDRFELNLDIEENVDCEDLSCEDDGEGMGGESSCSFEDIDPQVFAYGDTKDLSPDRLITEPGLEGH